MNDFVSKIPRNYKMKANPRIESKCVECNAWGWWYKHHYLFGSNKKRADYFELWGAMCDSCHDELHRYNPELADKYRKLGQEMYEERFTREQFLLNFGRNYGE